MSNTFYNRSQPPAARPSIAAKEIPENYVEEAENRVREFANGMLTTTKIRHLLGLFTESYNEAQRQSTTTLTGEQLIRLKSAQVRMIYESGRDNKTMTFIQKFDLITYLKSIGTQKEKLLRYYRYFEAIVAYARYYESQRDGR